MSHTAPIEIAAGVWRITTPLPFRPRSVHAYLARGDAGWMLVDGGLDTEEAWRVLDDGVAAICGGWEEVRLQVVTHMHMDHVGLLRRARAASGAAVAMGELDAERSAHAAAEPQEEAAYRTDLLRRCGLPPSLLPELTPAAPNSRRPEPRISHPLPSPVAPLPLFAEWTSVWTPGHTAGHTSIFRSSDGLLLAGDAVLPRITPTIGVNRQRTDPVQDYLDALERLRELAPLRGAAGHGDPMEPLLPRLQELRAATLAEGELVASFLSEPRTVWEIVRERYRGRDLPASAQFLALRETLAHLEHLAIEGRVERDEHADGATRFRAV